MDTMTPFERLNTAIRLGKPDRVPVAPIIDFFSSRYGGITAREMLFDVKKADRALEKTLNDLGPIDGQHLSYAGFGRLLMTAFPVPPLIPGVDGYPEDRPYQFVEKSVMGPEEYRQIAERGFARWMVEKLRMNHPELEGTVGLATGIGRLAADALKIKRSNARWRRKGVEPMVGANLTFTPMEWISLALRSFNDFVLDLFRYPDDIKAASRAMTGTLEKLGLLTVRLSGIRRVFMGGNRTSASFMSPKQFEEFALPEWEEMCRYYSDRGVTVLLHLDSDWTPLYPLLRNLPRGCILNLDGMSDIFRAKEVLGDRMCIMGDVPATLLKLGEPDEVDEYCRRLIMELGADGGLILSSGCTIPHDARPENVEAMLRSVHRYRP